MIKAQERNKPLLRFCSVGVAADGIAEDGFAGFNLLVAEAVVLRGGDQSCPEKGLIEMQFI